MSNANRLPVPAAPRIALLAAACPEDHELAPVLARALDVPVLAHVAPLPARTPRSAAASAVAGRDVLLRAALDRARATLRAVPEAAIVLATAGSARAPRGGGARWTAREVVVRLERPAPGGPAMVQAAEACTTGPRPERPWHGPSWCPGVDPGRSALVLRAAAALRHHADRCCTACGQSGFGAMPACVVCGEPVARPPRATRPSAWRLRAEHADGAAWHRVVRSAPLEAPGHA